MGIEKYSYRNKRVLVVGGASGMGAAAGQLAISLGAHAIVMDVADIAYPVDQAIKVDLSDKTSIDAALAAITEPIDAVFSCAGVADGVPPIMKINFTSQRYIVDQLIEKKLLGRGASVTMISSAAGLAWMQNMTQVGEFLLNTTWDAAVQWVDAHEGTNNYIFSKQAMCAYVAMAAMPLLKQGIRLNSVLPGPTDTPLARANADVWLGFGSAYREEVGVEPLRPEQIAETMAFLCGDAASGITGQNLIVDWGHISAGMSGAYADPDFAALAGS